MDLKTFKVYEPRLEKTRRNGSWGESWGIDGILELLDMGHYIPPSWWEEREKQKEVDPRSRPVDVQSVEWSVQCRRVQWRTYPDWFDCRQLSVFNVGRELEGIRRHRWVERVGRYRIGSNETRVEGKEHVDYVLTYIRSIQRIYQASSCITQGNLGDGAVAESRS